MKSNVEIKKEEDSDVSLESDTIMPLRCSLRSKTPAVILAQPNVLEIDKSVLKEGVSAKSRSRSRSNSDTEMIDV